MKRNNFQTWSLFHVVLLRNDDFPVVFYIDSVNFSLLGGLVPLLWPLLRQDLVYAFSKGCLIKFLWLNANESHQPRHHGRHFFVFAFNMAGMVLFAFASFRQKTCILQPLWVQGTTLYSLTHCFLYQWAMFGFFITL